MKNILSSLLFVAFFTQISEAQDLKAPEKYTAHNKGKFFIYWGGNIENYSRSDISFSGDNYNFTLSDVNAHDKPKGWHIDYINPTKMTIPQTNFRLGYFISDKYNVSFGVDHMKYVVNQNQTVNISGTINLPENEPGSIFNGTYNNTPIALTEDFLEFEHTDGLNYVNFEFARYDDISKIFNIGNTDKIQINISEGVSAGFMYPKTNARVLSKERNDEFHVAGYGVGAKVGLNVTFFKHFFILAEMKTGYIDMDDIRTTKFSSDTASQSIVYFQKVFAIGGIFKI